MELLLLIMIFTNEMKNPYKIKGLLEFFFFLFSFLTKTRGWVRGKGKALKSLRSFP